MKKNILVYGLISGLIISALMAVNLAMCSKNADFDNSMVIGYASMLIAFSMIFVGIKNYRDKYNSGIISFGKAFKVGFFITLVASTIYVIVWLVEEHYFFPDFMEKYMAYEMNQLQSSGISATELADKTKELEQAKEMYKNPFFKILFTYAEILPVGLVVTLISSLILKRKNNTKQFNTQTA
jgi:ethanolamine transporter EutH